MLFVSPCCAVQQVFGVEKMLVDIDHKDLHGQKNALIRYLVSRE